MRTFIAIEMPDEVKAKLMHVSENIESWRLIKGNFVNKDNFHLTLKFLGEISEQDVEKVKKKLSEMKLKKFSVKLEGIGSFPTEDYIKILFAKMHTNEIEKLAENVNSELDKIGFPKEKQGFQGHLTLARVNGIKDKNLLKEKLSSLSFKALEFDVEKLTLFKSELTPRGPIYKKLASFDMK
jgi:RNA 2',3'-cyclic 3'-phosphodiesterase